MQFDHCGVMILTLPWLAGLAQVVSTLPAAQLADVVEDTGKDASVQRDAPYTQPFAADRVHPTGSLVGSLGLLC